MNKLIQQDAQRPNVKCMIMILVLYHLRSHVLKSTAKGISLLHMIRLHTPSEVTDFDNVSVFDKYIFWLDISVYQPLFVQVVDARADLYEEVEGSVLAQKLFFSDQVEQVALGSVF